MLRRVREKDLQALTKYKHLPRPRQPAEKEIYISTGGRMNKRNVLNFSRRNEKCF